MNKLEEYKNNSANDCALGYCESSSEESWAAETSFKSGFDAAIALDLPVKFASWCKKNSYIDGDIIRIKPEVLSEELNNKEKVNTKELYDYWVKNVLVI